MHEIIRACKGPLSAQRLPRHVRLWGSAISLSEHRVFNYLYDRKSSKEQLVQRQKKI